MKKTTTYFLLALSFLLPALALGQSLDYAGTKEKVYVQTSHVFFKPGETMYFKAYVVKANAQTPTFMSSVVYVEIVGPSGNIVQKLNYGIGNGYAEGSYDFPEQAPGGVYKLRAYTTWMRNEDERTFFSKEITLLKVIAPRLLMKLDFPEKGYGAGDEVKADFSLRNLSDQPVRNHPATYKVSVGGEIVQTSNFTTDHEGKAQLRFHLPQTLNTTDGLLNITIQYESYTEAISRSIPIVLNKVDLQFMPEGGTLVQGIPSQVAFKAVNEHGKPVDVKGDILDSRGNKVAAFESYHFGMGKFLFTPQKDEAYKATITSPAHITQSFILPVASAKGIVMNITKAANDQLLVKLTSTDAWEITLTGQTKNTTWFTKKLSLRQGENSIPVDASLFPSGIARFTIYVTDNIPVAERLVFLNENRNLQVSIHSNKPRYLPREKVTLTIQSKDDKGNPVPSNLSLAVVDDKLWTFADDKQDHIISWLLMSSELKGKVEEPNFYFKKNEPKALPALDLVMLTNGYRYFDYIPAVNEGQLRYTPDQQQIVNGTIVNAQGQPVKAAVFLVHAITGGKAIQYNTAEDGVFYFSQLTPNSTYYLFAQAADKKEKVAIQVLQNGLGYNPIADRKQFGIVNKNTLPPNVPVVNMPLAKKLRNDNAVEKNLVRDFELQQLRGNKLEEVVVIGFGTQKKQMLTGSVAIVKPAEIGAGNLNNALQGRVAGLVITQPANPMDGEKVMIRGSRSLTNMVEPLIVLDGVPMEQYRLNALNVADIESITILKDAAATALYGSKAAYGVIVVETKKFKTGGIRFTLPARYYYASQEVHTTGGPVFSVARRFYAPQYLTTEPQERTDFRETIYWNGVIQTDKHGTAEVEFYNSDAATTFRAIAEGIGYNGKVGRAEYTYITKNALAVDAKIPPYLTIGDKALIPLVIKNNSIQDMNVRIKVILPANMVTADFPNSLVLPADSSTQVLIPVQAVEPANGDIQFIVETDNKTETIKLPISAGEKGFPVIATFSGNRSNNHEFMIAKMIPGSMHAHLKIFNNLEGQLLDGIESMLREPHGCFEQTSSSTYPNVYILKYLRESGKSNPEIEKKALDYIEAGYKRLIGFETSENGFEWFGHAPAHEALTAYGLLEFTDMDDFIKVDQQMLNRTKKFLLSRRDGTGGFTLASGGYDRFASVPNKIAGTYIVYALTQAGIGNEIDLEYRTAVKKALESNDAYQLAMMALAASNMKRETDYRSLMTALNNNYQKSNLAAETSVVNSRDASLRVETASLYALALMREASPDMGAIAGLVSKILGEKSYYGYGSTQATVLALQAMVGYSKLTGRISENPQITFTMNNTVTASDSVLTTMVHEGKNVFNVQYEGRRNAAPYNLEVAYNTLTPPNSAKAELTLTTKLAGATTKVGETMRMDIQVTNVKSGLQPMAVAKIGIPAGLAAQPWQLKELLDKKQVTYYEVFDNYLVLYWMGFAPNETKTIKLDLKAEIPGTYKGKASNNYLYYTPEYKNWNDGVEVEIQ